MGYTSIPVKPQTLERLRAYKVGGKSYDDLLNEMMDEIVPEALYQEHLRRLREEERIPLSKVKKELGL